MPKIFISYRRADSQTFTDRIYDRLAASFGESNVFQDVDSIRAGVDFRKVLQQAVESCDIVLVMIGSQWAAATDQQGRKRLFNTTDFVRIEVETALNSQKVVIPVIIEGAAMPSHEDIPPSLHDLLFRNAAKIRHNPDFNRDIQRLIEEIKLHEFELAQNQIEIEAIRQQQTKLDAKARVATEELEQEQKAELHTKTKVDIKETENQQQSELGAKANEREAQQKQVNEQVLLQQELKKLQDVAYAKAAVEAREYKPQVDKQAVQQSIKTSQPESEIQDLKPVSSIPVQPVWRRLPMLYRTLIMTGVIALITIIGIALVNHPPTSSATDMAQTQVAQSLVAFETQSPNPHLTITHNAVWKPVEQGFSGVKMVGVPAGCFDMGNDPQAHYWNDIEWVQGVPEGGNICFDKGFWLDKTEVTNAIFTLFGGKAANASYWAGANRPRETINWIEARDFCALRGARLPTEAEWEYAARGPDHLEYPWGNEFVADNVVYAENSNYQTVDIGSKPKGASWVGALDMSGNVWEWVSTLYQDYPYPTAGGSIELRQWINHNDTTNSRTLRGGSWDYSSAKYLRAADRTRNIVYQIDRLIGFRCAISARS